MIGFQIKAKQTRRGARSKGQLNFEGIEVCGWKEFYLHSELFTWESLANTHHGWSQGSSNAARCWPARRGNKYNGGRSWIAKKYFQIPQEMRFQNSVSWSTWFTIRNSHDCFKVISVTSCHFHPYFIRIIKCYPAHDLRFRVFKRLKLSLSVSQRQFVFTSFAFSVYYSLMFNLLYKIYLLYIGKQTLLYPSDKIKTLSVLLLTNLNIEVCSPKVSLDILCIFV